jgi:hypothetical protein
MNAEALRELKEWALGRRPDLPMARVLDVLLAQYDGPGTIYPPARILADFDLADRDAVLAALLQLSGEPRNVLKQSWFFLDAEGESQPITQDEVEDALQAGALSDPDSGELVPNFRRRVYFVYMADRGLDLIAKNDVSRSHE